MKTQEGKLKDSVKLYLDSIGAYWFMPVQTGYGSATVDFLVCWRGKFYGIETKAPKKQATPRQLRICEKIEKAGGRAVVSDRLDLIKHWFENVA